jgi:SAM-dependent methyltransferase
MSRLEAVGINAPQIEYWNGPAGDKWARLADSQDIMLGALGSATMDACDIQPGHMVLDVGCGSGTTTIEIARRVGAEGRVLGIDISTPMLDVGRARLEALKIDGVTFDNNDVATYPFEEGRFDRVFSRFGVMFFIDPIAAFTNIRKGVKSGGQLTFVCWQALDKNPWLEIPFKIALQHLPAPPAARPEDPGPIAFADPDRVRCILSGAGFGDIELESLETILPLGPDVPASVEKLVQLGPTGRLLGSAPDDIKARVADDLGAAISEFQTDNGVMIGSTTWIVSATSP